MSTLLFRNDLASFSFLNVTVAVLAHSGIITIPAMIMAVVGGLLIYGTIIYFGMVFGGGEEDDVGF